MTHMLIDMMRAAPELPRGVLRAGRRLTRTGVFTLESLARLRMNFANRSQHDSMSERAVALSWIAENLLALHGVSVHVCGELPAAAPELPAVPAVPVVLDAGMLGYVAPLAILAVRPAAVVGPRSVLGWPVWTLFGHELRALGLVDCEREPRAAVARFLAMGVSVLVIAEPEAAAHAAREHGAPLLAAGVSCDSPPQSYMPLMARQDTHVTVSFLPSSGAGAERPRRAA